MSFFDKLRGKSGSKSPQPQVQYSDTFEKDFDFTGVVLGSGQFGCVSVGRSKHTNQEFAVKVCSTADHVAFVSAL